MDLPEPPRPDLRPPPAPTPQTPVDRPIWKRGWFWIGVFVVLALIGTAIENGQGEADADNASPTAAQPDSAVWVGTIPVFDGQPGGQVVALVNKEGVVSAKVLGELPTTCAVTAGDIVQWDNSSSSYQDTGQVATDITGEPATSLMATFFAPSVPAISRGTSSTLTWTYRRALPEGHRGDAGLQLLGRDP